MSKNMKKIEDKIRKFEYKFNEEEISEVRIYNVEENEDYYFADLTIIFNSGYIHNIEGSEYPKKLIDIFEV